MKLIRLQKYGSVKQTHILNIEYTTFEICHVPQIVWAFEVNKNKKSIYIVISASESYRTINAAYCRIVLSFLKKKNPFHLLLISI